MQDRAYNKSIKREILSSKARFASILAIIFLGVAFYSGIKSSGPDIKASVNEFYKSNNLMDSKIVSSLGLTEEDIKLLENNDKILDYYGSHSVDANLTNINSVVRFIEYNPKEDMNLLEVVEGRLPENSGEIALDEKALEIDKNLKIGDKYTIECDKDTIKSFKKETYKIVGFVKSPMYIDKESRGTTSVGKGSVDYFAVLNHKDISMDVYTEIYITFKNLQNIDTYGDEYKEKMEENITYLENLYSKRQVERVEEIKSDAQKELDKAYKEVEDGERELLKGEEELKDGKEELKKGKAEYEDSLVKFNQGIKDGEVKLVSGEKQLKEAQKEIDDKLKEINLGQNQLQDAKYQLDKAKENFLSQNINPEKDTSKYEEQIKNLTTLQNTYDLLYKDINNTVNNTKEGDEIPSEKIQYWKSIISNKNLGLTDLQPLVNQLEQNPSNKTLAQSISKNIEVASNTVYENKSNLQILVSGIKEYQSGKVEYEKQLKTLNNGKKQLEKAQAKIDKSKKELEQGKIELEKSKKEGQAKLDDAKKEIELAEEEIVDGEKEIEKNKKKLQDAKEEIDDEQEKLNKMEEAKYYFFDRTDNFGYSGVGDAINSLDKIASVFPVFFFLVAIMICLTTMTRMVEENRTEIGTLKALGYSNLEISKKFVVYASLASISGSILGILVGSTSLPIIINFAYSSAYNLPKLIVKFYPSFTIQSIVLSILCTVGASLFVLNVDLRSNPSEMMRPKAPKVGKKILLERITFLWRRLNFNQKVTLRNIFRYKQRMIMTVLGIAGCMAMLVTGFNLQASNKATLNNQFKKLWNYEAMVVFDEDASKKDDEDYNEVLKSIKEYDSNINMRQESVTFNKENMNKQTAMLYVPENTEDFGKFVLLNNRKSEEVYKISNDGVIITEKLANLLGASEGSTITMRDGDNNIYNIKVDHIVENYFSHFIYMSPSYYEKITKKKVVYNAQLLKLNSNDKNEEEISTKLINCDKVINVTLTSKTLNTSEESTASLNIIMLVLIFASGCLAFVVLYNLNNINVSERIRELSTIKVLGFYDNEVTMYILRENVILTLLGIFVGSFMGKILYTFIIKTAELDTMMMMPNIYMTSYMYSALITVLFSLIVMIMMHLKLKKVNMIDALKSNE